MIKDNIFRINHKVNLNERSRVFQQRGAVFWLTGLSGSGKSTIALEVEKKLVKLKKMPYLLDGDNIRSGLNSDLGFSESDRVENLRRITEVALLFKDTGIITLVSFITPFRKSRDFACKKIGKKYFYLIYIKADIETCKKRDPKKLYKKAFAGKIKNFTGITSIYENPINPDLEVDTDKLTINEAVKKVLDFILIKSKL